MCKIQLFLIRPTAWPEPPPPPLRSLQPCSPTQAFSKVFLTEPPGWPCWNWSSVISFLCSKTSSSSHCIQRKAQILQVTHLGEAPDDQVQAASSPPTVPLLYSTGATLASLLFLECTREADASGPLHMLCHGLKCPSPDTCAAHFLVPSGLHWKNNLSVRTFLDSLSRKRPSHSPFHWYFVPPVLALFLFLTFHCTFCLFVCLFITEIKMALVQMDVSKFDHLDTKPICPQGRGEWWWIALSLSWRSRGCLGTQGSRWLGIDSEVRAVWWETGPPVGSRRCLKG